MRRTVLIVASLSLVAIAGAVALVNSPSGEPCPADGEAICPPPPDCIDPELARRRAEKAMRGPGRGLPPFGFNDGSIIAGQAEAGLVTSLHERIGAGLIRFALDWRRVEPEQGRFNFSAEDAIYCAALERGVAPVIAIAAAPRWAAERSHGCPNCLRPPTSSHLDELRDLATRVARRYPGAAAIEAWNEPNIEVFWEQPDARRYLDVLAAISEGVERGDERIPVLGGSLANAGGQPSREVLVRFVNTIYRSGAGKLMDAFSIHPYPVFPADDPRQRYDDMLRIVKRAAAKGGLPAHPIWITELGLRTPDGAHHDEVTPPDASMAFSPEQQAETLTTLYGRASRDTRIEAVIFHTLIEPDGRVASQGGYGWLSTPEDGLEPKPVWCRMLAISRPGASCSVLPEPDSGS